MIAAAPPPSSGTLSVDTWEQLLPAALTAIPTQQSSGAAVALGYLGEAGLIRGGDRGQVPYPTWVAQGVTNDAVAGWCRGEHVSSWGAIVADGSRQAATDLGLDALSDAALCDLLRALARHGAPMSLAELGALEASLAALGRRIPMMERPLIGEDLEAVQRLVLVQIESLVAPDVPDGLHHLFTRRDVGEWLATAWAISLYVAPPAGFSREDLAWELPGWASDLDLRTLPARTFP